MVGLTVLLAGRQVRTLGVAVPVEEIAGAARALAAAAVGLSVSLASARTGAEEAVHELRAQLPAEVFLWLGGSGASGLANLPGGVEVMTGLDELEAALTNLPPG